MKEKKRAKKSRGRQTRPKAWYKKPNLVIGIATIASSTLIGLGTIIVGIASIINSRAIICAINWFFWCAIYIGKLYD